MCCRGQNVLFTHLLFNLPPACLSACTARWKTHCSERRARRSFYSRCTRKMNIWVYMGLWFFFGEQRLWIYWIPHHHRCLVLILSHHHTHNILELFTWCFVRDWSWSLLWHIHIFMLFYMKLLYCVQSKNILSICGLLGLFTINGDGLKRLKQQLYLTRKRRGERRQPWRSVI